MIQHNKLTSAVIFGIIVHLAIVSGATGDILGVRILPNGWMAEIDIDGFSPGGYYYFGLGGNNTLKNPTVTFNVVSEGYNDSGSLTTINRTVYGTHWIRSKYPNQTIANETDNGSNVTVRIALSDFIYNDDKNGGAGTSGVDPTVTISEGFYYDNSTGGTNMNSSQTINMTVTSNSALDYPRAIGRWAWPGYERMTEDFLVEAISFHRSARYGRPVAAVKFLAVDQSGNSTESITTTMTISNRSNSDANKVLVYATTIDIDTFSQGEVINITFTAHPWVGDENAVLNASIGANGVSQPDERLGPLYALNDKDESYGIGYAYVSNSGNDGTGTVYATQAAAEAGNAFGTIENAAEALRVYHNDTHSRDNAGGGVILLAEGNYTFPGDTPANLGSSMDTWMIITHASNTTRAGAHIQGGANQVFQATRLKFESVNFTATSGTNTIRGRTSSDALWLHNNTIHLSQTAPIYSWKAAYATQNYVTALSRGFSSFSTTKSPYAIVRGNTAQTFLDSDVDLYCIVGNHNIRATFSESNDAAGHKISDNSIYAFNVLYDLSETFDQVASGTNVSTGVAIVQNVIEKTEATEPLLQLSADSSDNVTNHIILWRNTFVGQRENLGYNDLNQTDYQLNWNQRFNIFDDWNNKDDVFTRNATSVGGWPVGYNVGSIGNLMRIATFDGEFDGLYTPKNLNASYVDDNSYNTGDASGNGNYTLNKNSSAIDIVSIDDASVHWVLPYDLLGNPIYDSPDAGAYERQPPFALATDQLNISSTIRIYGDEKWQIKSAGTNNSYANLTITIPGSDTSHWIDINITEWNNLTNKTWTESSTVSAVSNITHVVGELSASTDYVVTVDGVRGANITGATCSSGICTSDTSGALTFNYTGTYSNHTFHVGTYSAPVSESSSSTSSSSSSSSGGGSTPSYTISESQLAEGYSASLGASWKIRFKVDNETHELKIDSVDRENQLAIMTVSSTPQTFTLQVNESKKLNINDDDYFETEITLASITTGTVSRANVMIKAIYEEIVTPEPVEETEDVPEVTVEPARLTQEDILTIAIIIAVLLLVIAVLIKARNRKPKWHKPKHLKKK